MKFLSSFDVTINSLEVSKSPGLCGTIDLGRVLLESHYESSHVLMLYYNVDAVATEGEVILHRFLGVASNERIQEDSMFFGECFPIDLVNDFLDKAERDEGRNLMLIRRHHDTEVTGLGAFDHAILELVAQRRKSTDQKQACLNHYGVLKQGETFIKQLS